MRPSSVGQLNRGTAVAIGIAVDVRLEEVAKREELNWLPVVDPRELGDVGMPNDELEAEFDDVAELVCEGAAPADDG